jgi:hypothetical protein
LDPKPSLTIQGELSAVEKALRSLIFHSNYLNTLNTLVKLTISDQGNFGKGGIKVAGVEVALSFMVENSKGYELMVTHFNIPYNSSSGKGAVNEGFIEASTALVNIDGVGLVESLYLSSNKKELPKKENVQVILSTSLKSVGEVASSSSLAAMSYVELTRTYLLDISGHTRSAAEIQILSVEVPWRYERQSIELYTYTGIMALQGSQLLNSDILLTFEQYNRTEIISFSASDSIENVAMSLSFAMNNLSNTGVVVVEYQHPSDTPPHDLFGVLLVTFQTATGDQPLIHFSPSTNLSIIVKEIEKGTLQGNVQDVNITSIKQILQGEFIIVFLLNDLTIFRESAPISIFSSAYDTEKIISNIQGIGLVTVSKFNNGELNLDSSLYEFCFRIEFHTYGGDVQPLIVVLSSGSTDTNRYPTRQICDSCVPFTANTTTQVIVATVTIGTDPIGGAFQLGLNTMEGGNGEYLTPTTSKISPDATEYSLASALRSLPGVIDAEVWKAECSAEKACKWYLTIWHRSGRIPALIPVTSSLMGSGVRVVATQGRAGVATPVGSFKLRLSTQDVLSPVQTGWIETNASALNVANAIRDAVSGMGIEVAVSRKLLRQGDWGTSRYLIKLSLTDHSSSLNMSESSVHLLPSGQKLLMRQQADVPFVSLGESSVVGTDVLTTIEEGDYNSLPTLYSSHSRYLLSLNVSVNFSKSICYALRNHYGAFIYRNNMQFIVYSLNLCHLLLYL